MWGKTADLKFLEERLKSAVKLTTRDRALQGPHHVGQGRAFKILRSRKACASISK